MTEEYANQIWHYAQIQIISRKSAPNLSISVHKATQRDYKINKSCYEIDWRSRLDVNKTKHN
jgi:hypothetical protein